MTGQVDKIIAEALLARPVVFGPAEAQLAGWFHPPASPDGRVRDVLVVMVYPLGYEAISTHRHYRVLAQRLAGSGFAVLRYDHHGTGDSSGGDEDPGRLKAWTEGVATAIDYGRQCSGASRVSLFGIRFGGTLALAAGAASGSVDSLVAWAPFASGSMWLREVRAFRSVRVGRSQLADESSADHGEEAIGYRISAETVRALEAFDPLAGGTAPAAAILLLARDDVPESERLPRRLPADALTRMKVAGYAAMMRDTYESEIPLQAFAAIVEWLESRHPLQVPRSLDVPVAAAMPVLVSSTTVCSTKVEEAPIRFGSHTSLFGITCRPADASVRRRSTGLVFVTVGSNPHVGPNRMYVNLARAAADCGFVSLRIDIGGVGESDPAPGQRENHLYGTHSVLDVRAAIACMRTCFGVEHCVLIGLCSGAYLSFHTAAGKNPESDKLSGIVLINPQTFLWREGDSLQQRARKSIRSVGFYRKRLSEAQTWRRLLYGQIKAGVIITGVTGTWRRGITRRLGEWLRWHSRSEGGEHADVRKTFVSLLRRGVRTLLVYSDDDGGLNEVDAQLGSNARALSKYENFRMRIVKRADHTFTPLAAQRELRDLLIGHLLLHHGEAGEG